MQLADRQDQIVEETPFPRRKGPPVALERNAILVLARNAPFLRRDFRMLAHALASAAIGDGRDVELDVAEAQKRV